MNKLISELNRLYIPAGAVSPETLAQRMAGQATPAVRLASDTGLTRAMVIPFDKMPDYEEAHHWNRLCEVAHALQSDLGFPAPAVSISGVNGYGLWLSLETPVPTAQAQEFLELFRKAHCADIALPPDAAGGTVELPPCLHESSGKWSAFIHPGMGASFADEAGLEMAPPLAGQAAFLESLHSIGAAQFQQALTTLRQSHGAAPAPSTRAPAPQLSTPPEDLLLKDATLEDIVSFLHSKNIEPTFRHLMPKN